MNANFSELLKNIPGPASEKWPAGERFAKAFSHGTMTVELYVPLDHDPQLPHDQDELYFIVQGTSEFVLENERLYLNTGDSIFVPAGAVHRFENFSSGFATWAVFWGVTGGE